MSNYISGFNGLKYSKLVGQAGNNGLESSLDVFGTSDAGIEIVGISKVEISALATICRINITYALGDGSTLVQSIGTFDDAMAKVITHPLVKTEHITKLEIGLGDSYPCQINFNTNLNSPNEGWAFSIKGTDEVASIVMFDNQKVIGFYGDTIDTAFGTGITRLGLISVA
jgi:hypothetical protein